MLYLVVMVLIAGAVVTFSLQNGGTLSANFLLWQFDMPVSTLIVVSVLAGIVVAQLLRRLTVKRREKPKTSG